MGEEISYVPLTPEDMRTRMEQEGMQPMWINFFFELGKEPAGSRRTNIFPGYMRSSEKPPRLDS